MKRVFRSIPILLLSGVLSISALSQGDVRSATGMPIPIGAAVLWGQVELKGLRPNEPRPTVYVTLLFNGAQLGRAMANDRGYYYFMQRARDGATLLVTVGGQDVGSQNITSAGGDRYDMVVNWSSQANPQQTGTISARDTYPGRSGPNSILFEKATSAVKAKKADEGIRLFSEIVANDPKDFVAWTELGSLYFGKSDFGKAEEAYKTSMELKPDFMPTLMNLGKLYIATKNGQAAVPVLEKAVSAAPQSAEAFHYLGEAYLLNRQGSKAVPVLNEAIRLDPAGKAEIHLRLATLYNAAGYKDRAAAEYQLFLQKKPDHPEKSKLEKYIKENQKP